MSPSVVFMKFSPYPIGVRPVSQPLSVKAALRQTVRGLDASLVPLKYFHELPLATSVLALVEASPRTDGFQLWPSLLSRSGWISSIE